MASFRPGRPSESMEVEVLGKSTVEFCGHALTQMELRGITKDEVLWALRGPTETGLPTDMFHFRIRRQINPKKALDVVYEERKDKILIVTAFKKEFGKRK